MGGVNRRAQSYCLCRPSDARVSVSGCFEQVCSPQPRDDYQSSEAITRQADQGSSAQKFSVWGHKLSRRPTMDLHAVSDFRLRQCFIRYERHRGSISSGGVLKGTSYVTSTPTALHHSAQGCRVREATLGQPSLCSSTLKGLNPIVLDRCNPFRVETDFAFVTQGSSSLATLGWRMEPRWGSGNARPVFSEPHTNSGRHDHPKAALKRPHSKRCRVPSNTSKCAKRLECGRFSAAFPPHVGAQPFATPPSARQLELGAWNLFGVWSLGFGVSAARVVSAKTVIHPAVLNVTENF